ncbi:MAG TPA: periplasmic heavy metal sensor [Thermoanaerobaculia bacterium]
MKKSFLIAIVLAAFAASAFAQLPPGKWWRRPDIINQLALSEEQQERLDAIFRSSANDLIDLRGAVEKENIALRGELDQPQLNRTNIQHVAARLSEARARLFQRELAMLVDMRTVLSDQQWNHMRAELDQLKEQAAPRQQLPRKMRER